MKTITFYSYKGGVGRSLALSNVAIRLSEFKRKVCVIDFDIEAPGIHFKFKDTFKGVQITKGLVDYIHSFSCDEKIPKNINDFITVLKPWNKMFAPIHLLPAGDIDSSNYWRNLSSINWSDMFYSEDGRGIQFFLDLKAKIQKEINPDFLLIDSRTGITDISGITLKVLADEVVVLAAHNHENIEGSKKIIKELLEPSKSLFGKAPKVNFLLTRLPFTEDKEDRIKENAIVERIKFDFKKFLNVSDFDITVIHSDRSLEENEKHMIGYEYDDKRVSVSNDYLKLFDMLTKDILSPREVKEFKDKKNGEKEYLKSRQVKDNFQKLEYLNKAISFDPNKFDYLLERIVIFIHVKNYDDAIKDIDRAFELSYDNPILHYLMAIIKLNQREFENALSYVNKSIEINPKHVPSFVTKHQILVEQNKLKEAKEVLNHVLENLNPTDDLVLNCRAHIQRLLKEYSNASVDIFKAIELNPVEPTYFATLAEICAAENKIDEFYLNLSVALSNGLKPNVLYSARDIYEDFRTDEKFLNLLAKYNIDVDEIFLPPLN